MIQQSFGQKSSITLLASSTGIGTGYTVSLSHIILDEKSDPANAKPVDNNHPMRLEQLLRNYSMVGDG